VCSSRSRGWSVIPVFVHLVSSRRVYCGSALVRRLFRHRPAGSETEFAGTGVVLVADVVIDRAAGSTPAELTTTSQSKHPQRTSTREHRRRRRANDRHHTDAHHSAPVVQLRGHHVVPAIMRRSASCVLRVLSCSGPSTRAHAASTSRAVALASSTRPILKRS